MAADRTPDPAVHSGRAGLPLCRIVCLSPQRWMVVLPHSAAEHFFADPGCAEAFLRRQIDGPVMVEISIGDFYVAAQLDPGRAPLFGPPRGPLFVAP